MCFLLQPMEFSGLPYRRCFGEVIPEMNEYLVLLTVS